jgi:hypothetical protein
MVITRRSSMRARRCPGRFRRTLTLIRHRPCHRRQRLPPVDRAALGRDAIDGLIVAFGVHVPRNLAAFGKVGAKAPVESARKHKPRDGSHRGRLRGTASRRVAATGMRGPPDLFSGFEFKGPKSSAGFAIDEQRPCPGGVRVSTGKAGCCAQGRSPVIGSYWQPGV